MTVAAWPLVAFAAVLAGCTATARGPVPSELLEDCLPTATLRTETNADLSNSVAELAKTLKLCNIDKRKLREWVTQ